MNKEKLIARYEAILEDDESEAPWNIVCGVLRKLKEGCKADLIEEERGINMQHMDADYFKSVKWVWNDAIKVLRKEEAAQPA